MVNAGWKILNESTCRRIIGLFKEVNDISRVEMRSDR
jgi:hypothetical protein